MKKYQALRLTLSDVHSAKEKRSGLAKPEQEKSVTNAQFV